MATALYKALNITETEQIKKQGYFGTETCIDEFSDYDIGFAHREMDSHIRNGSTGVNQRIYSTTYDFSVSLEYAKPTVVIESQNSTREVVHVKIHRSPIAVFIQEEIEGNILKEKNIPQYNNGKGLGEHARNIYYKEKQEVITGRIKKDEFYILGKIHQDLLFCCYETETDFLKILNIVIDPDKQKEINEFCKTELNPIEKIIYRLIYSKHLNLYEVAAPVYYSNNSADIYCIYDALFEILLSILKKVYKYCLGVTIPDSVNVQNELLKVYNTELNVLCLGGNYDSRVDSIKYIESIDFSYLFNEYNIDRTKFGDSDYIWKLKLERIEYNYYKTGCDINSSPLFLYLPKPLPDSNKIIKLDDYLLSKKVSDTYFQKHPTEHKYPVESYSCKIKVDKDGHIVNEKNKWGNHGDYSVYFNLSILYSELYISPYYTSIEPTFFSLSHVDKDCFNFFNSTEKGMEHLEKSEYYRKRSEYFYKHRGQLHTYADRLIKVFGGCNLESADYDKYLKERGNKRSCKDKIENGIKKTDI